MIRPTRRPTNRDAVLEAMLTEPDKSWTNHDLCVATKLGPGSVLVGLSMLARGGFVESELRDVAHDFYPQRRFYWLVKHDV